MNVVQKLLGGDLSKKAIKRHEKIIPRVDSFEKEFSQLSDSDFPKKTEEFKQRLEKGETLDALMPEAFALVRVAAKRVLGQRHYDVQLIGGAVLHEGNIAEMRTGEGKTLTATLAVYLNALSGKGSHVITVNDYLAKRDASWMGSVYYALGLSTGCLQHQASFSYDPDAEGEYALRECHRKEAYAADITYGTNNEFGFDYLRDHMAQNIEDKVQRELNFAIVDEVDSILIDEARTPLIISAPAEESEKQYYDFARLVTQLTENKDYNVDEKMRAVSLTDDGISKLEKSLGIENIYAEGGVKTVHHIEQALKAHVLFTKDKEYVVKDDQVVIVDEFTGRLMPGRRFSEGLHQALEAKENLPIARESITLASITFQNYFRLYKKLSGMTGTAATEAEEFLKIYGLEVTVIPTNKLIARIDEVDLVYKTEKAKLNAVVEEIKKRQKMGQPVLVGTISIEKNEALSTLLTKRGVQHNVLNAKQHESEAKIIENAGKKGSVTVATNMAGRGVDIILGGLPPSKEKMEEVKALGGLFVIGTERHDSRRIDNQLRGRAGRQGDPGLTRFYISLEDDLMRIFGGERMKNVMERLNVPEDVPIQNKIIARQIEGSQKKVEGHNFDARKHVVEYDDVINKHRATIYEKRDAILYNAKMDPAANTKLVMTTIEDEIEQVVSFHTAGEDNKGWNLEEIWQTMHTMFPFKQADELSTEALFKSEEDKLNSVKIRTKLVGYLGNKAKEQYMQLTEQVNSLDDSHAKEHSLTGTRMQRLEKAVLLRSIDTLWVEHLEAMDHIRRSIGLKGYGQQDPLIEYKKEGYRLFTELINLINKQTANTIYKVASVQQFAPSIMQRQQVLQGAAKEMTKGQGSRMLIQEDETGSKEKSDLVPQKQRDEEGNKLGRNDPCFCGSGKKYKKCHGA